MQNSIVICNEDIASTVCEHIVTTFCSLHSGLVRVSSTVEQTVLHQLHMRTKAGAQDQNISAISDQTELLACRVSVPLRRFIFR